MHFYLITENPRTGECSFGGYTVLIEGTLAREIDFKDRVVLSAWIEYSIYLKRDMIMDVGRRPETFAAWTPLVCDPTWVLSGHIFTYSGSDWELASSPSGAPGMAVSIELTDASGSRMIGATWDTPPFEMECGSTHCNPDTEAGCAELAPSFGANTARAFKKFGDYEVFGSLIERDGLEEKVLATLSSWMADFDEFAYCNRGVIDIGAVLLDSDISEYESF